MLSFHQGGPRPYFRSFSQGLGSSIFVKSRIPTVKIINWFSIAVHYCPHHAPPALNSTQRRPICSVTSEAQSQNTTKTHDFADHSLHYCGSSWVVGCIVSALQTASFRHKESGIDFQSGHGQTFANLAHGYQDLGTTGT